MMRKKHALFIPGLALLFLFLLAPVLIFADTGTIDINADGTLKFSCTTPTANCPPPSPAPKSIGNLHGAIHPVNARADSATCYGCHKAGGEAIVGWDKTICSQYDFFAPGRTLFDPATGANAIDPVSKLQIISGNETAVLKTGETVRCSNCHYPHKTANAGVTRSRIHQGCLDCHVAVGNSNLKPGVPGD